MAKSAILDRRNLDFMLYEVVGVDALLRYPRFAEHSRETFDAVADLGHQLALEKFLPHYRKSDLEEPELVDGRARIIPEVKQALDAYVEAGFMGTTFDTAIGGMQLPFLVETAAGMAFAIANLPTLGYGGLTKGVANLIEAHADETQKRRYLEPLVAGHWFGTMCLSEPHAGSSLADIRTRAVPSGDGDYLIEGAKMWISAGDHELSANIVHMVLAKLPDAPPGVKGISLFIVPKYRANPDGSVGERNDVTLAGVNHKMGYRGTVNCFLKFGEAGNCRGELVGEPHTGLAQMFHMMNEERIGVGLGAISLGYAGYLHSLEYARERRQGRHPDQRDPTSPPVPIIEHADVKRMLLMQKCYVEGAFALAMEASRLIDVERNDDDVLVRREAHLLLELLTPIIKAWSSDWCLKANELAIQVLGGYGYTREYPVEQHYRDNRLNSIHEGTNGIQALDLLGRKAMMEQGAALKLLFARMQASIDEAAADAILAPFAVQLGEAMKRCGEVTRVVGEALAKGQVRLGLANASHYMHLLGHTAVAWMWLRQATVAARALDAGAGHHEPFYRGKLAACRFFFGYELPTIEASAAVLLRLDDTTLAMQAEWF
jgi:alkylation response protein AidB-like acyl-CoA dehydrogenase